MQRVFRRLQVIDLMKFVVFMIMMLMAYGVLRQSVTYPFEDPSWDLAKDIFLKPYFNVYGEMYSEEINRECHGVIELESTLHCSKTTFLPSQI
jgi:hypothetical protein